MSDLTQVETIALGSLKAESQRLQAMNLQFNAAIGNVVKEIEDRHPGYTLNISTLQLEAKPVEVVAELAPVINMPYVEHNDIAVASE